MLWKRWPRWTVTAAAPRWSSWLLACGWTVLAASTVLWSPWVAAVAMVLSVGGLIGRYVIPGQWRDWLPVWLVMWLIVPPPLALDFRLISWLQSSTSRMASFLLDLLGVLHLMEGHVLVLPGHRMLVDEACSGVNSVLVLLVLTSLFVVAARRPLLWSALLLASSVAWAWAANMVRVATIAIAQAWFQLDLSSGWQHELLGYVTISLALAWLASTDCCLAFLLRPIVLRSEDLPRFALRSTPLTNAWNWCVGAEAKEHKGRKRRGGGGSERHSPVSPQGLPQPTAAVGVHAYRWLGAFGLLGALQLAGFAVPVTGTFAVPAADRTLLAARFQRADMPENLDGWSLVNYELAERESGATMGQFSSKWLFRRGSLECLASVDYTFPGWHDLTVCYRGNGWVLLNRRDLNDEDASEVNRSCVEAELSKPTGEYGWLLFGLFDRTGKHFVPPGSGVSWLHVVDKLASGPLVSWLVGRGYMGDIRTTYQVQVFASRAVGLSPAQRAEVRQLFLSFRSQVITAYLGRATEGERKP